MSEAHERLWTRPFTLLMSLSFLGYVSLYLTLPTLPVYVKQLGGTDTQTGLTLGIFSTTALLVRPWSGWVSDRFGTKRSLLAGMICLALATAAFVPARSVPILLIARVLHGVGWGFFGAAAATLAAQLAPPARRGAAIGVFGFAQSTGLSIGPIIGVALGQASFVAATVVALVGLVLTAMLPTRRHEGVVRGPSFTSFVHPKAALPAGIFLFHMSGYGAVLGFITVMIEQRHLGNSGWYFSIYAITLFLFRSVAGKLSDRIGRLQVILPGMAIGAVALATYAFAQNLPTLLIGAVLYAIAMSALQPVTMAWAADRSAYAERGAAISTIVATQDLGITIGSFLAGLVADTAGLKLVFFVGALWELLGLLSTGLLWRYRADTFAASKAADD